jgi:hypothetical protein
MSDTGHRIAVTDRTSGKEIIAVVVAAGEDLVVTVGGGEKPHVGCVVVATPVASRSKPGAWSASCSVLTIPPHKEEPIARAVASAAAAASGRVVVTTAGVHDDGLDRAGIEVYLELGERLAHEVAAYVDGLTRHTD